MLLGEQVYNSMFQTKVICPAQEQTRYRFIRGEAVGKALPRGEGKKDAPKAHVEPAMCRHPEEDMQARGNKISAWWTCKKCMSRWERVRKEDLTSTTGAPSDLDMVSFGKHAGSTFQETYLNDPSYCEWAVRTAEEGEANHSLRRLAQYILSKRMTEVYEADETHDMDL